MCFKVLPGRLEAKLELQEALVEENVDFRAVDVKKITATGIAGSDGEHREYDSIVCATGFDSTYRPRVPIGEFSPAFRSLLLPPSPRA